MIKVMMLPVKLLAFPVMVLLFLFSLLGKAASRVSAYIVGPFLLLLLLIDIYCLWNQQWTDFGIVTAIGVVTLALQFGAMFRAEIAGEWGQSLKAFIFS